MNRRQYILAKLAEECNELAKQCIKQMQFGRFEVHEKLGVRNCDLLRDEALDVIALINIAMEKAEMPAITYSDTVHRVTARKRKMKKYMRYSRKLGLVK